MAKLIIYYSNWENLTILINKRTRIIHNDLETWSSCLYCVHEEAVGKWSSVWSVEIRKEGASTTTCNS